MARHHHFHETKVVRFRSAALNTPSRKPATQPLAWALDAVGDPWSFLIMQEAFFGVRRFEEFQKNLGIARNTLTDRLARLTEHRLLSRVAYQERPPRYEYRLMPGGLDCYPYALALMSWGDRWQTGGEDVPVTLRHLRCGARLRPLVVCGACQREIRAHDVAINPISAKPPAAAAGAQLRSSSRPELYTAGRETSVSRTLALIGDRWAFYVLWLALAGITRFEHFQRILGVARTILAARLERLVKDGLLERKLYCERPPRYEYGLTAKGLDLCPVLLTLFDWARRAVGSAADQAHALHKACGEPLRVDVICGCCREVVNAADVEILSA